MLPLTVRIRQLFFLGVWATIAWVVITQPAQGDEIPKGKTCTLIGADSAGSDQQILVYTGPSFEITDGSYGLPGESVQFLDYQNNSDAGEEWFKVKFPKSGYEGWIIRYHINCPADLWKPGRQAA